MIASVSTNLNSIIITVQSKVCYYFKQRGTIDTQGRSLSFLTGDAQGCSDTRKMLAASHFIKMMFLPFVLASTSLLQNPPSALTFSVILKAVQKAFLVQGLKYYSGCFFIFLFCFQAIEIYHHDHCRTSNILFQPFPCAHVQSFPWPRFPCLASGLWVELTSATLLHVS